MKRSARPTSNKGTTKKRPIPKAKETATVPHASGPLNSTSSSSASATSAEYIRVRMPNTSASHKEVIARRNGILLMNPA